MQQPLTSCASSFSRREFESTEAGHVQEVAGLWLAIVAQLTGPSAFFCQRKFSMRVSPWQSVIGLGRFSTFRQLSPSTNRSEEQRGTGVTTQSSEEGLCV